MPIVYKKVPSTLECKFFRAVLINEVDLDTFIKIVEHYKPDFIFRVHGSNAWNTRDLLIRHKKYLFFFNKESVTYVTEANGFKTFKESLESQEIKEIKAKKTQQNEKEVIKAEETHQNENEVNDDVDDYDDDYDYSGGSRSPNDDRSDSMNQNNPSSQASRDNRSNQLNRNNPRYQGK